MCIQHRLPRRPHQQAAAAQECHPACRSLKYYAPDTELNFPMYVLANCVSSWKSPARAPKAVPFRLRARTVARVPWDRPRLR